MRKPLLSSLALAAALGTVSPGIGTLTLKTEAATSPSLSPAALPPAVGNIDDVFKRALFDEEGRRDYEAAMRGYEQVVRALDEQRRLAASSIFRLAECYRKLQRTNDAVAQYQRLLREFSDEGTLAQLSRQNLKALDRAADAGELLSLEVDSASSASEANSLARETTLLESRLATLRKLDSSQIESGLLSIFPEASQGIRELRRQVSDAQARIAELKANLALEHPEVKAAAAQLRVFELKLEQEKNDVFAGQETRLAALREALAKTKSASTSASNGGTDETLTAAETEAIRRIQGLVANSPDLVDAPAKQGKAPLHEAAELGQMSVARYLLDHGAKVDVRSRDGLTPLHYAATAGHKAMAELLVARGADVNATEKNVPGKPGRTPLHSVSRMGYLSLVEWLVAKGAKVDALDGEGTPLAAACLAGKLEVMRLLLDRGANPNLAAPGKKPPLAHARSIEGVRLLLSHKADPNPDDGSMLLYWAQEGRADVIALLLDAGTKADGEMAEARTDNSTVYIPAPSGDGLVAAPAQGTGTTPLWFTLSRHSIDHQPIAELLLKHGANINQRPQGQNGGPIHLAVASRESGKDWLPWVLAHGGNPNLESRMGMLPYELAAPGQIRRPRSGKTSPAEGLDPVSSLRWSSVRLLLEAGADPNRISSEGFSLAHYLAVWAGPEEFELLRKHGARFDLTDSEGVTPLMVAAANGNLEGTDWLIAAGVDVQASDAHGNTALHQACSRQSVGVVKSLIQAQADPGRVNRFGDVPAATLRLRQFVPEGKLGILIRQDSSPRIPTVRFSGETPPPTESEIKRLLAQAQAAIQGTNAPTPEAAGVGAVPGNIPGTVPPAPGTAPTASVAIPGVAIPREAQISVPGRPPSIRTVPSRPGFFPTSGQGAALPNVVIFGASYQTVPLTEGRTITLLEALKESGISTNDRIRLDQVKLHRATLDSGSDRETRLLNVEEMLRNPDPAKDPVLQAGDRIEVSRKPAK
jgi:ankyrin repeat protein